MIYITGNVPAWTAVYGVTIVQIEKIFGCIFFYVGILSLDADVFDYLLTLTKRPQGSQAEAGFGTKHLEICMIFYLLHWTILA